MRSAQIKFGESIGIIIIVYLVIVAGFIWYNKINANDLAELSEQDERYQAFEKYYFIVNLDLLHISSRGYVDEEFDINSLRVLDDFASTPEGDNYLNERLGNAVVVLSIYNHTNLTTPQEVIVVYNKTSSGEILSIESFKTLIPVVDESVRKTHIGILDVSIPVTN